MPTNESDELAAIRQTAEMVVTRRREVEAVGGRVAFITLDDLRAIEQQLFVAYTLGCHAEALREQHGQEATPA